MNSHKKLSLMVAAIASVMPFGAMAAEADSTMTVSANLTNACEISGASAIDFGSFAALASTGEKTANSGSTFQVACSNSASPTIYASGARSMSNGGGGDAGGILSASRCRECRRRSVSTHSSFPRDRGR